MSTPEWTEEKAERLSAADWFRWGTDENFQAAKAYIARLTAELREALEWKDKMTEVAGRNRERAASLDDQLGMAADAIVREKDRAEAAEAKLAEVLAVVNGALSGRVYDDVADAVRQIAQVAISERGNAETLEAKLAEAQEQARLREIDCATTEAELAAAHEALLAWNAAESLPDCPACANLDAVCPALRSTEEPKP